MHNSNVYKFAFFFILITHYYLDSIAEIVLISIRILRYQSRSLLLIFPTNYDKNI